MGDSVVTTKTQNTIVHRHSLVVGGRWLIRVSKPMIVAHTLVLIVSTFRSDYVSG